MATSTCFFLVALVCGAVCNPLGQTTLCEKQNRLNGLLQALESTAVCDATPNLLGMGYGHGLNLQGAPYLPPYVNGLRSTLPNIGLNPFSPYGISPGYGSTTVCDSVPNVGLGLGVVLGGLSGLGTIVPGPTTLCESTPNVGLGIGCNGYGGAGGLGAIVPGSTAVCTCENTPNFGPGLCYGVPYYPNRASQANICEFITPNVGLGIGGNGYGGAGGLGAIVPGSATVCTCESTPNFGPGIGYGVPYFPNSAGQTNICESISPNLGLGIGCNEYGGAGGLGAIVPGPATLCTCESTPNFGSGIGYGVPYFPNSAGQGNICDSITPNVGLGIGCSGYGGAGGRGAIIPGCPTVCTCEGTPNFGPGLGYGGPYFPNRAGQTNICESIPNVSPGYLYGVPRYNNFGTGLGYGYQHSGCRN